MEGAVDFNQQVTNLKNAGCEVVYLPIYYTEANLIIRNAVTTQGWQPDFFGCDGLDGLNAADRTERLYRHRGRGDLLHDRF